jgi:hypothetical protein
MTNIAVSTADSVSTERPLPGTPYSQSISKNWQPQSHDPSPKNEGGQLPGVSAHQS